MSRIGMPVVFRRPINSIHGRMEASYSRWLERREGARQQLDPFIITDCVGRQASALRQIADLHTQSCFVVTLKLLRVRAHSKSRQIGTGFAGLR
jgi:hypothetical protein